MNNNHKHPILRTLTALALCCSPLACDQSTPEEPGVSDLEPRAAEHFDGAELFAGIVLGQGAVAEKLVLSWEDCERDARISAFSELPPDLMMQELERLIEANGDEELTPALQKAYEALASGETAADPQLGFELITQMVKEADPEYFDRLEEAVYSGNRPLIREAVLDGFLLTKGLLTVENSVIELGTDQDGVAVLFVAVAVVAYILVWIEVEVGKPGIDESALQLEVLVNEIAQNIAGY